MKVLVGCEESQAVTIEMRRLGHEAYSCDLKPCSGGHPEWHLQMDVFEAINSRKWDMGIFFPDCTYITVSGLHWNKRNPERALKTEAALQFVSRLMNLDIPKIAIENPVGCISSRITMIDGKWAVTPIGYAGGGRKPSQIIQPYNFGSDASKATCLWLKGLPALTPGEYVEPRMVDGKKRWGNQTDDGQNKLVIDGKWIAFNDPRTKTYRSKTYPGIAKAMADQWGDRLIGIETVLTPTMPLRQLTIFDSINKAV